MRLSVWAILYSSISVFLFSQKKEVANASTRGGVPFSSEVQQTMIGMIMSSSPASWVVSSGKALLKEKPRTQRKYSGLLLCLPQVKVYLSIYRPVSFMSSWNSLPCLVSTNFRIRNLNWYYEEPRRRFKVGWFYHLLMDMTAEIPEHITFAGVTMGWIVHLPFYSSL